MPILLSISQFKKIIKPQSYVFIEKNPQIIVENINYKKMQWLVKKNIKIKILLVFLCLLI